MNGNEQCPCGSGRVFDRCCKPLLNFHVQARTPKQLMRSRYTAYALGGYRDYLVHTWHPRTASTVSLADLDMPDFEWKGLEILRARQKGDYGIVDFKATFSEDEGPDEVHRERSVFHRLNGRWLYVQGEDFGEEALPPTGETGEGTG